MSKLEAARLAADSGDPAKGTAILAPGSLRSVALVGEQVIGVNYAHLAAECERQKARS